MPVSRRAKDYSKIIHFNTSNIVPDAIKYMKKFGEEAKVEIFDALKKIGKNEERNTQNRLTGRSTTTGDIFDKVGNSVNSAVLPGNDGMPFLRFGAGKDFEGVRSQNGEVNIAGILAFGKRKGKPSSEKAQGFYKKLGGKIYLPKGYESPAKEPESAFLDKAQDNIIRNIEQKVPEALRKAFGEVSF